MKKLLAGIAFLPLLASAAPATKQAPTAKTRSGCCGLNAEPRCVIEPQSCFCRTIKHYPLRSQSYNGARLIAGGIGHVHQFDIERSYVALSATVEYNTSIRANEIAQSLFGADLIIPNENELGIFEGNRIRTRQIFVQGSDIQGADRDSRAWLADNFYLPKDYQSLLSIKPHINNMLIDFDLYVGLDGVLRGTYIRIHGPFVHSRWTLDLVETVDEAGTSEHPIGYFASAAIPRSLLVETFESYANGAIPDELTGDAAIFPAGNPSISQQWDPTIIFQPLKFAKMSRLNRFRNGFADLRIELGWNVWQSEERHVGIAIHAAAPTGPRNDPTFLFNPIIGNGRHWEIGGSATASRILWSGVDGANHLGFSAEANITYLLEEPEIRTFELKGRPNGVYMLAAKFGANGAGLSEEVAGFEPSPPDCNVKGASRQFAFEYAPVANLSTMNVNIGADIQADVVLMFNITSCGFSFDLGYNFWINRGQSIGCPAAAGSCDKNGLCADSQKNTWALKGDARMFGYKSGVLPASTNPIPDLGEPVALSATENSATIHNGTNASTANKQVLPFIDSTGALVTDPINDINKFIDNPKLGGPLSQPNAGGGECITLTVTPPIGGAGEILSQINTSIDPIFLKCSDIDFVKIRSKSHKFFFHVGFNRERDSFVPHIGVGAFVEIGKSRNASTNQPADGRISNVEATPSFWGVWLKGGVSF